MSLPVIKCRTQSNRDIKYDWNLGSYFQKQTEYDSSLYR